MKVVSLELLDQTQQNSWKVGQGDLFFSQFAGAGERAVCNLIALQGLWGGFEGLGAYCAHSNMKWGQHERPSP